MRQRFPIRWFRHPAYLEFEGHQMPVPEDYDKWLTISYGDYMQLPPPEERVYRHDAIFIDLEHSYKHIKASTTVWMKRKRESHVEAEKYVLHPEVYADRTGDGDDARADAGGTEGALQACFLEIIKDIDRVCQEHGLCYMAAGGTALGSRAPKGFIPWDDDVDILMPREDLNRFVELFEECMGDKYELTTPNSDKYQLESMISAVYKKNTLKAAFLDYNTPFPKGVHIDIFAIESVPRNPIVRGIKGVTAMGLQYIAVSTLVLPLPQPGEEEVLQPVLRRKVQLWLAVHSGLPVLLPPL